jgi:23S rRNA (guanine745-N1)-methyltransferase
MIAVDPDKSGKIAHALGDHFTAESTRTLRRELKLSAPEARTLIGMTPSARHTPKFPDKGVAVTAAVDLTIYR